MDYSLVILTLVLVLIIFFPFFYVNQLGKKSQKHLLVEFEKSMVKHKFNASTKEHWNNRFLALDSGAKKLLFGKINSSEVEETIINLKKVSGCRLINTHQNIANEDTTKSILKKLDLELTLRDSKEKTQVLCFFNADDIFLENHEIERGEKWKRLIQQQLIPEKAKH